jgi:hypothetical protein
MKNQYTTKAVKGSVQWVLTGVKCYIIRYVFFKDAPLGFVFQFYSVLRYKKPFSGTGTYIIQKVGVICFSWHPRISGLM